MNCTEKKVYTVMEIVDMLGISRSVAYSLVRNNPPFRVLKIGDTYWIPKESFDRWFETGNPGMFSEKD